MPLGGRLLAEARKARNKMRRWMLRCKWFSWIVMVYHALSKSKGI